MAAADDRLTARKSELTGGVMPKGKNWETQAHFLYFSFIVSVLLAALLGQSPAPPTSTAAEK